MHMSKTAGVSFPVSSAVVAGYTQPKNTSVKNGCFSMPGNTMSAVVLLGVVPLACKIGENFDGSAALSALGIPTTPAEFAIWL